MEQSEEIKGEVIIYKDDDGPELKINVQDDTVWMNQAQLAELFQKDKNTISEHIQNVFKEGELSKTSTVRKFRVVQNEGKRQVLRDLEHYNLDVVISVGYRVKSKKGTQFRIWATQKLRDYLLKGYLVNEARLREAHENRLKELQQASSFIRQAMEAKRLSGYEKELISLINDYTQTWVILNRYDEGDLEISKQIRKNVKGLEYVKAKKTIEHLRDRLVEHEIASGTFAQIDADLIATNAIIAGVVKGNVTIKQSLTIAETGRILGNISCSKLEIRNGAMFIGNCRMQEQKPMEIVEEEIEAE